MFDTLTERLDGVFSKLRKRGKLHPKQVDNALADVRTALLEADVAVEVADDLLARVRSRATSEEVLKSLTPAQQVVKVMNEELTVTLGGEHRPFTLPGAPPVVVLLAGVQGSGKTTACAKLAKHLKSKGRRPLLVGADLTKPTHVLMACDAMTGQDAVIQAREFMHDVDTTGFILTKLDGDARGGAALSMTAVTGRPIFFAGTGERLDDLEPFYPDRMAGRILGMGDVLTLIEKAQGTVDTEKAAAAAEQMLQGRFNLEDFLEQLRQMRKLGPIQDILKMLPGVPGGKNAVKEMAEAVNEAELRRAEAMSLSMTLGERR